MSASEAWIADCHILGIEGDEEFRCQAAVWANSPSEFRTQLDRKLKGQGFRTLWLEECLKVPEYIRRHGQQQKIGALARAVHPGHLVELSKAMALNDGAEAEPESYLTIEEIAGVEPLDQQFQVHPKKTVPDTLHDVLFGPSDPTEAELEHHGDANVPEMKTYAILDAAKLLHLPVLLASSDLKHRCLFKGDAAEDLKNVAPYLVELEDGNTFTRNLFTSAGMPSNLWDREPGIYIRSRAHFDDIWRHFRKFTRVKDENNKWFMFRFWDNKILAEYLMSRKQNLSGIRRFCFAGVSKISFINVRASSETYHLAPVLCSSEHSDGHVQIVDSDVLKSLAQDRWHRFQETLLRHLQNDYPRLYREIGVDHLALWSNQAREFGYHIEKANYNFVVAVMQAFPNHEQLLEIGKNKTGWHFLSELDCSIELMKISKKAYQ